MMLANQISVLRRPSGDTDPYFADVLLLMDARSTVTTDASSNNWTLTTGGTTASSLVTEQTLFGSSVYKAAVGGSLSTDPTYIVAPNDIFGANFGANEFTIEGWYWIRFPSASTSNLNALRVFFIGNLRIEAVNTAANPAKLYVFATNIGSTSYSSATAANTLPIETWFHVAVVRDHYGPGATDANIKTYIDGVKVAETLSFSKTDTYNGQNMSSPTGQLVLWADFNTDSSRPFYMGGLRVTKNVCRYKGDFTPPSAMFPNQ